VHTHHEYEHLRELKLYLIAFLLSLLAGILEIIVSFFVSGSVALFSDATHGISDGLTYGVLAIVVFVSLSRPGCELAFTKIGVWISFILLFLGDYLVFSEAVERIFIPRDVLGWTTFFTAGLSFALNGIVIWMMRKIPEEEHNIRHDSMSFHALSDFFVSIGVICSALVIALTGWREIDWIIAIAIAFYLLFLLCLLGTRIARGDWNLGHNHEH
jgi:cobalt-zinc-cadmium efflux system protein